MNEFQVTMLGASGVGKTTLLLAMYEQLHLIAKDIGFELIPDEETQGILNKYLAQLKALEYEMKANERDKGVRGTRAAAGPDSLPKYIFDLVNERTTIRLIFRDYPGGYLTSNNNEEREFVKQLIQDSHGVIITIDTPAMLEPKKENFKDRRNWDISNNSGRWHEARNQPQEVLDLFKGACTNRLDPKIVILAPVKCETYLQTPESCNKLIDYIKEKYALLLTFLQGRSQNIAVITAPVETVGCLHFWRCEIEEFTRPRFWFHKTRIDAVYDPKNGDELLRYLLSFLFKIGNDQTLAERSPVLRRLRKMIGHHTPFEEALKIFAQSRKENEDGFTIIQGKSLLIPRKTK